jgi:hypothetical protein
VSVKFEMLQTLKDADPRYRHIVVGYRTKTEQE